MKFEDASRLSLFISKSYSRDIFKLLNNYRDISASEAASRLGLHIQTVQDFLETMLEFKILNKKEALEKKRPYFRYNLNASKISIEIDLIKELQADTNKWLGNAKIREKKNNNVRFSLARNGKHYSNVSIWTGKGRERTERKISLTTAQGEFLYHLPLPTDIAKSIINIQKESKIENDQTNEIKDLLEDLIKYKVIEIEA